MSTMQSGSLIMPSKKKYYTACWRRAIAKPSIANVSFWASSDVQAKAIADRVAAKLGVTKTPRSIVREDGKLIESIDKGVSR